MPSRITLVAAAGLFAASFISASATTITPGTTASVDPGTFGGTQVATTGSQTISPGTFTGTYTENVYSDPNNAFCAGCLDFVVQVSNVSPSGSTPSEIIARESSSSFNGFLVDAFYQAVPGDYAPEDVNWDDAGGGVIAFDYLDTPLQAGQTTDFLILDTNATTFTPGFLSLQDGSAGTGPGYQPLATSVTPEPSSLALMGTGLLGLVAVIRRRTGDRGRQRLQQA